jgi:nicotinamidase-related amidase
MMPRTLRELAGVAPAFFPGASLATARTAVLLIDYQHEYRTGPLALPDEVVASAAARRLRCWADRVGVAVIHVLHRAPAGAPLFAEDSPGEAPLDGLAPATGETVIHKRLPSAFTGTGLADVLAEKGIDTLLIAGYMTHNCVDSTAREAFHRGFRVAVIADASATRDLPGVDGVAIPAAVVHAAVLAGLGDRIAEIVDVATVIALDAG